MASIDKSLRGKEDDKFDEWPDETVGIQTKSILLDKDGTDIDNSNPLPVDLTSDIQGVVEIKDHDGTDRVEVTSSNALKVDGSAVTQPISGEIDVNDISKGTQTNDVKITLDSETVQLTIPTGIEGGPVTVGTTPVEMTFTGTTKSLTLMSDSDNTGKIWWGPSNIDNTGANVYGRLTPDSSVSIEFEDSVTAIYCVSDTASQKVYKVALT